MHVHPAAIAQHSINTYAAGTERAPAAQRAAEVRKRILKSAQSNAEEPLADPDATLLIGQWLDARHSQVLPADEYHTSSSGKDPDLG
jgi:hypothetical protein